MLEQQWRRRHFLLHPLGLLGMIPSLEGTGIQQTEVATEWVDLPPNTTLWGVIAFFGTDLIEVSIGTREDRKATFRGRFGGKRLIEYSFPNTSGSPQRIGVRARAVGRDRDLSLDRSSYWADNLVMAFGRRPTPADPDRRAAAYPHEAVLLGFRIRE